MTDVLCRSRCGLAGAGPRVVKGKESLRWGFRAAHGSAAGSLIAFYGNVGAVDVHWDVDS